MKYIITWPIPVYRKNEEGSKPKKVATACLRRVIFVGSEGYVVSDLICGIISSCVTF
jgi:hypothetical protein